MANTVELLKQYKQLLDEGIITQEEFEAKREQLLSEMQRSFQAGSNVPAAGPTAAAPVGTPAGTPVGTPAAAPAAPPQMPAQNAAPAGTSESTAGWAVLGFFFPLVGLILFLVWNTVENKAKGKSAGKGALIGVIVGVLGWILLAALGTSMYY